MPFIFVQDAPRDYERRCCKDCYFLVGAVSLLCDNKNAVKFYFENPPLMGYALLHCRFWKPNLTPREAKMLKFDKDRVIIAKG